MDEQHKLDAVDKQIADLLMENGRMSSATIASRLGAISERAVRHRIDRLVTNGIIRITAIACPSPLGFQVTADVYIQVEAGAAASVAEAVAAFENVNFVAFVTGTHDISAQVLAHDNAELFTFVNQALSAIPGVRRTTIAIIPQIIKDIDQWHIPPGSVSPD